MAILKIARMGHPVLRRRAEAVADPTAPEVRRLIGDMIETMADADGLGLAAPQVHVPARIVIFHVPAETGEDTEDAEDAEDAHTRPLRVLINPTVEPLGEETALDWEGCLSVPGLRGKVPRYSAVRYRATALDGGALDFTCEGMHARVVQHECDHLDGILYPMRMTDLSELMFESEIRHQAATERRAAEPAAAQERAAEPEATEKRAVEPGAAHAD